MVGRRERRGSAEGKQKEKKEKLVSCLIYKGNSREVSGKLGRMKKKNPREETLSQHVITDGN